MSVDRAVQISCLEIGATPIQVLSTHRDLVVEVVMSVFVGLLELSDVVVDVLCVAGAIFLHGGATLRYFSLKHTLSNIFVYFTK